MKHKHPLRSDRVNEILQTEEGKRLFIENILKAKDRNNIPPFSVGDKIITVKII